MPTDRKNSPSRMPRNGSMSASSWWRKVDSDSSTPAMNAPIAIDRPPHCMNSAAPSTTSSAAAVITSRPPSAATMRNSGLSAQRPAAISPPIAASATSTEIQAGRDGYDARALCDREERDQREQRHDREILEQQDRHRALACRRGRLAALVEHLHDHGRRGQHEAHGADQRPRPAASRTPWPTPDEQRAADQHLREAETEDLAAQGPELASAASRARSGTGTAPRRVRRRAGWPAGRGTGRGRTARSAGRRSGSPARHPARACGRSARR